MSSHLKDDEICMISSPNGPVGMALATFIDSCVCGFDIFYCFTDAGMNVMMVDR